ncbi:hypothetical protein [Lederbergia lenta]|uniref:hypothetical protein n=1 Tax=Lederbergia lenta TaxID=1467 RepID=UPI00203DF344|nr:hypothetical protein [Lederbergia lenta]MCM3111007.1 hypothetical protein [Lederbergia lenta]
MNAKIIPLKVAVMEAWNKIKGRMQTLTDMEGIGEKTAFIMYGHLIQRVEGE